MAFILRENRTLPIKRVIVKFDSNAKVVIPTLGAPPYRWALNLTRINEFGLKVFFQDKHSSLFLPEPSTSP